MARPSIEGVHVNLRIRRELRDKILARAERHHTSLNNMIRVMLEDGLEAEGAREQIRAELEPIKIAVSGLPLIGQAIETLQRDVRMLRLETRVAALEATRP